MQTQTHIAHTLHTHTPHAHTPHTGTLGPVPLHTPHISPIHSLKKWRVLNTKLLGIERSFLVPEGLPNRPFYK